VSNVKVGVLVSIKDLLSKLTPSEAIIIAYYNASEKSINLHHSLWGRSDINAISVAAHEAGHAVQYNNTIFLIISFFLRRWYFAEKFPYLALFLTCLDQLQFQIVAFDYNLNKIWSYFVVYLILSYLWVWFTELHASYIALKVLKPFYGIWHRGTWFLFQMFLTYVVNWRGIIVIFVLYERIRLGIL
jgi:hypothetical protein